MTEIPIALLMPCAMARAMASVLPPGAQGTISLIGLSGKAAQAFGPTAISAAALRKVRRCIGDMGTPCDSNRIGPARIARGVRGEHQQHVLAGGDRAALAQLRKRSQAARRAELRADARL